MKQKIIFLLILFFGSAPNISFAMAPDSQPISHSTSALEFFQLHSAQLWATKKRIEELTTQLETQKNELKRKREQEEKINVDVNPSAPKRLQRILARKPLLLISTSQDYIETVDDFDDILADNQEELKKSIVLRLEKDGPVTIKRKNKKTFKHYSQSLREDTILLQMIRWQSIEKTVPPKYMINGKDTRLRARATA